MTPEELQKDLVVWTDKLAIGIPVIDGEHQKLVALCNDLYKVVMMGDAVPTKQLKEAMRNALKKCADYAKYHFTHEEELMQYCHFNEELFKQHKDEHTNFRRKVLAEIQDFENEDHNSAYNFVKYLYDWIRTHIAHCDRLYVVDLMEYLKEKEKTQA